MSRDYYEVLGVPKSANDDQIRKAYKKLAVKTHPDKNPDDPKAADRFREVSEAYAVLSDKGKKRTYDQFGHEGLKGPRAPTGGRSGGPTPFHFSATDANDIFSQMFGGGIGQGRNGGFGSMGSLFGNFGSRRPPQRTYSVSRHPPPKDPPVYRQIPVSLEDLYEGKTKRLKITKKVNGEERTKIVEIPIRPGLKGGSKVTFEKEGDIVHGRIPADIVFVIEEAPHPKFERKGDDLIYTQKILLSEALGGGSVTIPTLEGPTSHISLSHVIPPGHTRKIVGRGMPKKHGGFGDLIVSFEIIFPTHLTPDQKETIKRVLP